MMIPRKLVKVQIPAKSISHNLGFVIDQWRKTGRVIYSSPVDHSERLAEWGLLTEELQILAHRFHALTYLVGGQESFKRANGVNQSWVTVCKGMSYEERAAVYTLLRSITTGEARRIVEATGVASGSARFGDGVWAYQALVNAVYAVPAHVPGDILIQLTKCTFSECCSPTIVQREMTELRRRYDDVQAVDEHMRDSQFSQFVFRALPVEASSVWSEVMIAVS